MNGPQDMPRAAFAFVEFAALLRAHGFAVAPEQTTTFLAAINLLGPRNMRLQHLRPGPAEALERLERAPRALPLEPFRVLAGRHQGSRGALEEGRHMLIAIRLGQIESFGEAARGRHAEARRVHKGEEFKQVEAR